MGGDVIVLAAGPSVKEYNLRDLEKCGTLIAVNGSSLYTKPHIALTMDRLVAEFCYPIWRTQGVPQIWIRKGIAKNFKPAANTVEFEHDGDAPKKMTYKPGFLNGSNSGTCAFNLALQLKPHRVFMLGFDMIRFNKHCDPYWYPAFSWNQAGGTKDGNLKVWAEEYVSIAQQVTMLGIEVYNVNHTTRLNAFPVIPFTEFKRLTK